MIRSTKNFTLAMVQAKTTENAPELEWIQMKKDFDIERLSQEEGGIDKLKRKFNENPLVPIGELILLQKILTHQMNYLQDVLQQLVH